MKKIKQKMSKITKIFLVLSLIFSNLSCLSTVFAYEKEESNILLELDKENSKIKITYQEETEEELYVRVSEKYTYLDDTMDEANKENQVSIENLSNGYESELELLSNIVFDGTYDVNVSIGYYEDEEFNLLDSNNYSEEFSFEKGFNYRIIANNEELVKENDSYTLPENISKFTIETKLNMGGITPQGKYFIGEIEYLGTDLLNYVATDEYDLNGHLYGPHQLSFAKSLALENGEVVTEINEEIKVNYKELKDNDEIINDYLNNNNINWNVESNEENGYLFIDPVTNSDNVPSAYDLDSVISNMLENNEDITYTLLDKNGEDIKLSYEENESETLEDYLKTIKLENGMALSISCCDSLTITYTITFVGDFNDDGILSIEDIKTLIDKSLDLNDLNNPTMDIDANDKVNILDVTYYLNILNDIEVPTGNGTVTATLENENENIETGEEFTINYVVETNDYALNGLEGTLEYDTNKLQLVSVEVAKEGLYGNKNGNKFAYVSDSELKNGNYTILNIKFKAKNEGDATISIKDYKFANGGKELSLQNSSISTSVTINASSNNNVSSIIVNGESIALEEDKYDYELNVGSDVTEVDIEAILENDSATKVINGPSVLEYGNNEFTITVTAKNGNVKIYKINVIREEKAEEDSTTEETTAATPVNNSVNKNSDDKDDKIIEDTTTNLPVEDTTGPIEKEEKKESNLSKIIIIILILLVLAALIYLIFKDDDDEEKKANRDINKYKNDKPQNTHRTDPRDNKKNDNNSKKGK